MTDWFRCNNCRAVFALLLGAEQKCPACGGTNGEVIGQKHVKEETTVVSTRPRLLSPGRRGFLAVTHFQMRGPGRACCNHAAPRCADAAGNREREIFDSMYK